MAEVSVPIREGTKRHQTLNRPQVRKAQVFSTKCTAGRDLKPQMLVFISQTHRSSASNFQITPVMHTIHVQRSVPVTTTQSHHTHMYTFPHFFFKLKTIEFDTLN